jgi:hypothetical protein
MPPIFEWTRTPLWPGNEESWHPFAAESKKKLSSAEWNYIAQERELQLFYMR